MLVEIRSGDGQAAYVDPSKVHAIAPLGMQAPGMTAIILDGGSSVVVRMAPTAIVEALKIEITKSAEPTRKNCQLSDGPRLIVPG